MSQVTLKCYILINTCGNIPSGYLTYIDIFKLHSSWPNKMDILDIELWEYSLKWPLIDQLHDIQIWSTLGHDPHVSRCLVEGRMSQSTITRQTWARGPVETEGGMSHQNHV